MKFKNVFYQYNSNNIDFEKNQEKKNFGFIFVWYVRKMEVNNVF